MYKPDYPVSNAGVMYLQVCLAEYKKEMEIKKKTSPSQKRRKKLSSKRVSVPASRAVINAEFVEVISVQQQTYLSSVPKLRLLR